MKFFGLARERGFAGVSARRDSPFSLCLRLYSGFGIGIGFGVGIGIGVGVGIGIGIGIVVGIGRERLTLSQT
jgi:hypothetical protein